MSQIQSLKLIVTYRTNLSASLTSFLYSFHVHWNTHLNIFKSPNLKRTGNFTIRQSFKCTLMNRLKCSLFTDTQMKILSPGVLRYSEPKISVWAWFSAFCYFYRYLIFWKSDDQRSWKPVKRVSATIQEHDGCNSTRGVS